MFKSMKQLKRNSRTSKAISAVWRKVERECPMLKHAYASWADKALVRNYHKNSRECTKKLADEASDAS